MKTGANKMFNRETSCIRTVSVMFTHVCQWH